ncbi:MAG: hypothetical protein IJ311_01610 [Elusimicrobiaceae bacterium]|nr:hypothetical protein [Elusimicrobiaceae bacterium]
MKRILICLFCFAASIVIAQTSGYVSRAVPADVYEALLVVNGEQKNSNMSLDQAKKTIEGTIVLEAGFSACTPCQKMIQAIEEEGLPSLWERNEVRFYQLQSLKDEKLHAEPQLIDWMKKESNQDSVPLLFIIKNGKVVAMYKGYNSEKQKSFIDGLKAATLQ